MIAPVGSTTPTAILVAPTSAPITQVDSSRESPADASTSASTSEPGARLSAPMWALPFLLAPGGPAKLQKGGARRPLLGLLLGRSGHRPVLLVPDLDGGVERLEVIGALIPDAVAGHRAELLGRPL